MSSWQITEFLFHVGHLIMSLSHIHSHRMSNYVICPLSPTLSNVNTFKFSPRLAKFPYSFIKITIYAEEQEVIIINSFDAADICRGPTLSSKFSECLSVVGKMEGGTIKAQYYSLSLSGCEQTGPAQLGRPILCLELAATFCMKPASQCLLSGGV